MGQNDAQKFWGRYKKLTNKDMPVLCKTGINQSTLSTWKKNGTYPRVDIACYIAETLCTTVEYLVTGKDIKNPSCSSDAIEIAINADKLNREGMEILKDISCCLLSKFAKKLNVS